MRFAIWLGSHAATCLNTKLHSRANAYRQEARRSTTPIHRTPLPPVIVARNEGHLGHRQWLEFLAHLHHQLCQTRGRGLYWPIQYKALAEHPSGKFDTRSRRDTVQQVRQRSYGFMPACGKLGPHDGTAGGRTGAELRVRLGNVAHADGVFETGAHHTTGHHPNLLAALLPPAGRHRGSSRTTAPQKTKSPVGTTLSPNCLVRPIDPCATAWPAARRCGLPGHALR